MILALGLATKTIQHLFLPLVPPTPWGLQDHMAQVTGLLTPQPGPAVKRFLAQGPTHTWQSFMSLSI